MPVVKTEALDENRTALFLLHFRAWLVNDLVNIFLQMPTGANKSRAR